MFGKFVIKKDNADPFKIMISAKDLGRKNYESGQLFRIQNRRKLIKFYRYVPFWPGRSWRGREPA